MDAPASAVTVVPASTIPSFSPTGVLLALGLYPLHLAAEAALEVIVADSNVAEIVEDLKGVTGHRGSLYRLVQLMRLMRGARAVLHVRLSRRGRGQASA